MSSIDIQLSQEELDVVVRAFTSIIDDPDEIDFSMMDLQSIDKLIPLNFSEWVVYAPYVQHAASD